MNAAKTNVCNASNQASNKITESDVYEDTLIGSTPNESKINGFIYDNADILQKVAYSTANMINYEINDGTTNFEYFDPDSYQIRNSLIKPSASNP